MQMYTLYSKVDGRVLMCSTTSTIENVIDHAAEEGARYCLEHVDGDTFYMKNDIKFLRPMLSDLPDAKSLSVSEVWSVAGVPKGSKILVDGELCAQIAVDGPVNLSFELEASYSVHFDLPFPWIDQTVIVEVA